MRKLIGSVLGVVVSTTAFPAFADTYTKANFSGGIFGGGANVSSPFSGNGFVQGQTFTGSFVYDNALIPAAGTGFVNVFGSSYPDAANIPAGDMFTLNFGPLTFTAAGATGGPAVQYNNGNFNGFFYVSDFAFQGSQYQLDIQGGAYSVRALDNGGNPVGRSLINGYINIGNTALTGQTPYVPVTNGTPAVPEPATWALMILGFGAIGGAMRRRPVRVSFA